MAVEMRAGSSRLGMRRVMSVSIALTSAAVLALGLAASALAGGSSITLHGPHANVYGTSFHYTASGRASGSANYVVAYEAPYTPKCANKSTVESARPSIATFVSQTTTKNKHFSLVIDFFARNLLKHRLCAYVINRSSHATLAYAEASWQNFPATKTPTAPNSSALQPTEVGSGDCQAKRFPDESVYAQIAYSGGAACTLAEEVGYGADAAKGAAYSKDGFSCVDTPEGAGSTWVSAWTGTYYEYSCADGAEQVAFNWGTDYAYVPASTLPTITPSS
jgi:hypothetical protein